MYSQRLKSSQTYPDIADSVLKSIYIPVISQRVRDQYVRPDSIHMYIPPELNYDSDEDSKLEAAREKLKSKYKDMRIEKVTRRFKNATGQVKYAVIWMNNPIEEMVPSKALQDHKDWDLVEHFEYQQAIRAAKKDKIY
ncbi:uncharacterized protein ATC70_007490 [Mucor velutinosus]|uniref:Chromo domain-containing protein n=1 Tax=Mucor velutinosus TaxID=708070 RepID=A0AAN7D5M5_9FUNG|nr:hypothetical protein ATC70_007490 [Mucor velutinosus]